MKTDITLAKAHNFRMGGVDRHDRLVGQHPIPLTSKRDTLRFSSTFSIQLSSMHGFYSKQSNKLLVSGIQLHNVDTHSLGSRKVLLFPSAETIPLGSTTPLYSYQVNRERTSLYKLSPDIKYDNSHKFQILILTH